MPGGLFRHHTFGKGEYQGMQSPSAATPGAAASPSILRHIHVLRTLRLSKSAKNFEEHEVLTVTGTPTSSTRLPVELVLVRVRIFTLTLAEVRLDLHSALSTYCATKWRQSWLHGNQLPRSRMLSRYGPRAAPGCVHASSGADEALHALGYLSCAIMLHVHAVLSILIG